MICKLFTIQAKVKVIFSEEKFLFWLYLEVLRTVSVVIIFGSLQYFLKVYLDGRVNKKQ